MIREYLIIAMMIPVWAMFHFINRYDRSILFIWRNKLTTGSGK